MQEKAKTNKKHLNSSELLIKQVEEKTFYKVLYMMEECNNLEELKAKLSALVEE